MDRNGAERDADLDFSGDYPFSVQLSQGLSYAEEVVGGSGAEFDPIDSSDPDLTTINTFNYDIEAAVAPPDFNPSPAPHPRSPPQPQPAEACRSQLTRNTIALLDEFQIRGRLTVQEMTRHLHSDNRRVYDSLNGLIHTGVIRKCHRERFYEYLGFVTPEPVHIAALGRNLPDKLMVRDLKLARLQELRDQLERARQTGRSYQTKPMLCAFYHPDRVAERTQEMWFIMNISK
jgi:hypothetical protein